MISLRILFKIFLKIIIFCKQYSMAYKCGLLFHVIFLTNLKVEHLKNVFKIYVVFFCLFYNHF